MINGIEGIPGSGKSYEAVAYHVLEALKKGRRVITNLPLQVDMFAALEPAYRDLIELRRVSSPVRGTWDADAASRDQPAYRPFEDGHTEPAPVSQSVFGGVWDYYSDWKGPDGNGPLFVIDEAHIAMPVTGTNAEVVQWYKLHRHFNADVLLMTQSFRDMNQPIARLMGILVKCRKADILGDKGSYIRKVHGGYRGGLISQEKRKYRPEIFGLYKSHTQGNSVAETAASDVSPMLVKFNRVKNAVLLLGLAACVWAFWPQDKPKPKPAIKAQPVALDASQQPPQQAPQLPAQPKPEILTEKAAEDEPPIESLEPYKDQGLHVTGRITMGNRDLYTFAVSKAGGLVSSVTSEDLVRAGYRWKPLTDCAGVLRFATVTRVVTCDKPMQGIPGFGGQTPVKTV